MHVAVRLFSNRPQVTSKCGKNNKVAHEAIAECVTDVLTTFWRLLWPIRELKHQTFLTTRMAEKPRKTGSRPSFLARNRKVKQSTFLRHGHVDMSSLKDARDMTLIRHSQGLITDEELLLLLEENTSRNPDFSCDAWNLPLYSCVNNANKRASMKFSVHDLDA